MPDTTRDPERVVRAFVDAWNGRAYGRLPELLDESYVLVDPAAPGGEVHGPAGTEAYLRDLVAGFSDFGIEILDSVAGEEVVLVELEWTGTHDGEFGGLPPTGRSVTLRGAEKHRVVDGTLRETRVYLDRAELRAQLGLAFPGVVGRLPVLVWRKLRRSG